MSEIKPPGATTFVMNVCLPAGQFPLMAASAVQAEQSPASRASSAQEGATAALKSRLHPSVDDSAVAL